MIKYRTKFLQANSLQDLELVVVWCTIHMFCQSLPVSQYYFPGPFPIPSLYNLVVCFSLNSSARYNEIILMFLFWQALLTMVSITVFISLERSTRIFFLQQSLEFNIYKKSQFSRQYFVFRFWKLSSPLSVSSTHQAVMPCIAHCLNLWS